MVRKLKRALALLTAALLLGTMAPLALAAGNGQTPLYEYLGYGSEQAFLDEWNWSENEEATYDWWEDTYQNFVLQCTEDPQLMVDWYGYTLPTAAEVNGVTVEELPKAAAWEMTEQKYEETYGWNYGWEEPEPPTLSVQLMGETVAFPDAQPETVNGRTMVPLRAMVDALHGETGYDGGASSVTAKVGETTVRFALGGDKLYWTGPADKAPEGLVKDGAESYLPMDVQPYEKSGRTYVPVRFFAEAFGLTVQWDEWQQTAVVYDKAALIDSIDSRFTVLNQWLAAQPARDTDQAMRMAATIAVTYTAFNSIDGDESFPLNGTLSVLTEGQSYQMDLKLDLYAMVRMLIDKAAPYVDEELSKAIDLLKGDLQNATFEMIYNADENTLYFRCPLLLKAIGLAEPDMTPKEGTDAWVRIEDAIDQSLLDAAGLYNRIAENGGKLTIGALIVEPNEASFKKWFAASFWQSANDAADGLELFLGDGKFTRNGDAYTARFDETPQEGAEGLAGMLVDLDIAYVKGSVVLNTRTGVASGTLAVRQDTYWRDQLLTYEFEGDAQNAAFKMSIHTNNTGKLEMEMQITEKPASGSPAARPPENDKVIDLNDWLGLPEAEPESQNNVIAVMVP